MVRHGFLISSALVLLAGCAHYRGMGHFETASSYTPPSPSRQIARYQPHGSFQLYWPLRHVHVNQGFHSAHDPHHEGVDLGGVRGTPVLAAHEGHVVYVGHGFHGYGNMVLLEYDQHWATLYAHLSRITVHEGQILAPGDLLGTMGATGHATGVHLHFELMHNRLPVDPLAYLPARPKIFANEEAH